MNSKNKKVTPFQISYIILLLIGILFILIMPKLAISSFWDGTKIWATKVLPALLPFFLLTRLLSDTPIIKQIGKIFSPVTRKLYGVGGVSGYIYLMSIISGYPVGAKLTADLYAQGEISSGQAETITSFTSTSGPLFIIGTVAIGMYNSQTIGFIILISHLLGTIINGLLYRNKQSQAIKITSNIQTNTLSSNMSSSISSIMIVGGFIAIFYMFLQILLHINFFAPITKLCQLLGIDKSISSSIIAGLIEVTSGCLYLSQLQLSPSLLAILSTFLISFGGFSIHAQAYTFLQSFGLSYKKFLLQKITQAILSTLISCLLVWICL